MTRKPTRMTWTTYKTSDKLTFHPDKGPFKCYLTQIGVGGGVSDFLGKKRYEGVMFNVISVMRGWVGVQFPEKLRYVTLEWPITVFS